MAVLVAEFGRGVLHPVELADDGPFVVNLAVTSRDGWAVGVGWAGREVALSAELDGVGFGC